MLLYVMHTTLLILHTILYILNINVTLLCGVNIIFNMEEWDKRENWEICELFFSCKLYNSSYLNFRWDSIFTVDITCLIYSRIASKFRFLNFISYSITITQIVVAFQYLVFFNKAKPLISSIMSACAVLYREHVTCVLISDPVFPDHKKQNHLSLLYFIFLHPHHCPVCKTTHISL